MDYEKKYKEALERARANHKFYKEHTDCGEHFQQDVRLLETIFPELAESEDERIRKRIYGLIYHNDALLDKDKLLAWLEKQKEPKDPFDDEQYKRGYDAGRQDGYWNGYWEGYKKAQESLTFTYPQGQGVSVLGCLQDKSLCTNPHHDCINCPHRFGSACGTYTNSTNIKED